MAKKRGESKALSPALVKSWKFRSHAGYGDKIFSNLTLFFTHHGWDLVALVFVLARDAMPAVTRCGFPFLQVPYGIL